MRPRTPSPALSAWTTMAEMVLRRGRTGYLLLLPAALWLGIFFVIPFYSLVATSLFDPSGSDALGYDMTYHVANYWNVLQDYWGPLVRSLVYGGIATAICLVLG